MTRRMRFFWGGLFLGAVLFCLPVGTQVLGTTVPCGIGPQAAFRSVDTYADSSSQDLIKACNVAGGERLWDSLAVWGTALIAAAVLGPSRRERAQELLKKHAATRSVEGKLRCYTCDPVGGEAWPCEAAIAARPLVI